MAWFSSIISSRLPTLGFIRNLRERSASDFINLKKLFFLGLVLGLEFLLVLDEFFFHHQEVLYSLKSEVSEPALRVRSDGRESHSNIDALLLLLLSAHFQGVAFLPSALYLISYKGYALLDGARPLARAPARSADVGQPLLLSSSGCPF